jgi:hypothetical protein
MEIIFNNFTLEIEKCKKITKKIQLVIGADSLFICYFGIIYNYYFLFSLIFSLIGFIGFKKYDIIAIRVYVLHILVINSLRCFFLIEDLSNNDISYIIKISLVLFSICIVLNTYILIITCNFYQLLIKLDKPSLIFLKNNE